MTFSGVCWRLRCIISLAPYIVLEDHSLFEDVIPIFSKSRIIRMMMKKACVYRERASKNGREPAWPDAEKRERELGWPIEVKTRLHLRFSLMRFRDFFRKKR